MFNNKKTTKLRIDQNSHKQVTLNHFEEMVT